MTKPFRVLLTAALVAGALQLQPASTSAAPTSPAVAPSIGGPTADVGTATVDRAKQPPSSPSRPRAAEAPASLAASCTPADFGNRTGSALVSFVQASTVDCVNTLFNVTGTNAFNIFREAQMVTIANAFRNASASYPGTNSGNIWQLVLFLRAGYFVQFYHPADVGGYGPTLKAAIEGGLDTFVANAHFMDVSSAHGDVLGEVIVLTDSSDEQARYLNTYKRVLNGYNSSYDAFWSMDAAVNDVYTPLFRGHQNPAFITAVTSDPSIIDALYSFAINHVSLLSTSASWYYLDSNAGGETARFLDTPALQAKVRPQALGLLNASAITGATAPLWVQVAGLADTHDQAQCSYYGTCNFVAQLTAAALPITYNCDAAHTFRAQSLTNAALAEACASVRGQDTYFHGIVKDTGPVANDRNTNLEIVNFASRKDYQTYAGWIFDVDTNNGGIYLEGDPAVAGNQPRFLSYVSPNNGFPANIWNLNHEYTHYLDGRYDSYGDFTAGQAVPDIWWIEGVAEYISYSYRGVTNTTAIAEAPQHSYALSTLWQTTYANSNTDRTYQWGYLAARYMIERHPADVQNMLARFRVGDYTGGYAVYGTGIGTRYDADFDTWLDSLSGASTPTANFTYTVNGLSATFTDTSTGTVASRQWNFGDGSSATTTPITHAYAAAGTYTVTLTVTGNGASSTKTASVTVTAPGYPECTGSDVRALDKNCKRSNLSATTGNLVYLYIYLPAGVSTLRISSAGGTGNADLYYNASTWATPSSYTNRSTNAGNTESLTVTNPAAGYRYVSLYAASAFTGVTVTTTY